MACKHTNIDCGCKDSFLTTPPPCPTPDDCPEQQPCSEVFDAQCIIYTGDDILCDQTTVVEQNTNVADALNDIVDYVCTETTITTTINCGQTSVVPAGTQVNDAVENVVTYFCEEVSKINDELDTLAEQVADCCTQGGLPLYVSLTRKAGDLFKLKANAVGGTAPYTYTWSMADIINTASDSFYELNNLAAASEASVSYNPSGPISRFDACASSNAGYIGLAKVVVTDANGHKAVDTMLIMNIICA